MKKLFTLMLMLFTVIGIQAATPDNLYIFGNAPFGDWVYNPIASGKATQMTKSGNKFTWSGTISSTCYFAFLTQDGSSWDDLNNNYRLSSTTQAISLNTEYALSSGDRSMKLNPGDYTITVDYSSGSPKLKVTGYAPEVVITGYSVIGAKELFGGNGWDTDLDMTESSTGVWTATLSGVALVAGDYEYKARANKEWGVAEYPESGNNTLTISEAGTYNIVFTLTLASSTLEAQATKVGEGTPENQIYVIGLFNGWDQDTAVELEKTAEGIFTGTVSLFAEDEFKILDKGTNTWYGGLVDTEGELHWITADHHTDIDLVDGANFYVEKAGEYTFTVDLNNLKLTVESDAFSTQPETETDLYVFGNGAFGNEDNWTFSPIADGTAKKMDLNSDGTYSYSVIVNSDSYFAFTTQDGTDWEDLNNNYRFAPEIPDTTPTIGEPLTLTHKDGSLHLGPGEYTLNVTLNGDQATLVVTGESVAVDPIVRLAGEFNDWNKDDATYTFSQTDTGYVLTATIEADKQFKLVDVANDIWYGSNDGNVELALNSNIELTVGGIDNNFYFSTTGDYTFNFNVDSKVLYVTTAESVDVPENFYILGNDPFGGWQPNNAVAMTKKDNTFTWSGTISETAWFSFTSLLATNDGDNGGWDEIVTSRYGAESNGLTVSAGNAYSVIYGNNENAFMIEPGEYTFTVTFNSGSITLDVTGEGGSEDPFVLPDCATWVEGKQFAYFEKPAAWGSNVYAYTWQDGGAAPVDMQRMSAAWPGDVCEYVGLAENGNSVYRYAVDDADFNMIIFNDGEGNQTGNFNFTNGGYYRLDGLKAVIDSTTGITGIEADVREGKTKAYNLQGMEVRELGRGIYIINGKKVLRK